MVISKGHTGRVDARHVLGGRRPVQYVNRDMQAAGHLPQKGLEEGRSALSNPFR